MQTGYFIHLFVEIRQIILELEQKIFVNNSCYHYSYIKKMNRSGKRKSFNL